MCHHQDVGGRTPGSVPTDATELYQEGVIIPPTQLFRAGELDENLLGLLTRNVRLPDVFTGDLMAQVAAGRLGGIRLRELFAAHGTETVLGYIEELLTRAEALTRRQIESIPDGEYRFEDYLDNDGVDLGPAREDRGGAAGPRLVDDVRLHGERSPGARAVQLRAGLHALRGLLRDPRHLRPVGAEQRRVLPRRVGASCPRARW